MVYLAGLSGASRNRLGYSLSDETSVAANNKRTRTANATLKRRIASHTMMYNERDSALGDHMTRTTQIVCCAVLRFRIQSDAEQSNRAE